MKHKHIIHRNFYESLFERSHLPIPYSKIGFNNKILSNTRKHIDDHANIYAYSLFPNYLNPELGSDSIYTKIKHKPGFAIDLTNIKSVDDYLKNHCKSNFRKLVLRSVRRLETSFDINYKMFFGEISKTSYTHLMKNLFNMITERFQERAGRNKVLENWDYYLSFCYKAIHKKEASLFVIYDNNTPIEISLNFHYDCIMYSSISSYDLNYAKFSLGNIDIYKQLEWCINNRISLYDMGYGDFDYKRRWSNLIYNFETHIIARQNSVFFKVYSAIIKQKTYTINFLINKGVNDLFYNAIGVFKKNKKTSQRLKYMTFDCDNFNQATTKIDVNNKNYAFLKIAVSEYLYKYQEHINDIAIYQILNEDNAYVIVGKNNKTKLKFVSDEFN